jgi:ABC-type glycerol-3-phosphate transport system substrate-binding protein
VNKEETMKKIIFALLSLAVLFAVAACSTTVTAPVEATNNPIGSKVGEQSETVHYGWLPRFNESWDASAYKAAQNGGITRIATVDVQRKEVWRPFYGTDVTYTTIVTGE